MSKINKLENEMSEAHGKVQEFSMKKLFSLAGKIVKREKYKNVSGMDAIHYYLIQKHNWLPSQVKTMSAEDLALCLEEEKF